ncbi:MAG: UDP-N-acetylmuramoyl-tripeptide--D-alanyl-D-alanine ligase [Candidatus Eisenbacteria bacterium]|nr:UDP-N-acetylmuramoyl-tripeptide--D-alanyl-D-alanine ligase [Candidatus Eisenbacteria bacterium]
MGSILPANRAAFTAAELARITGGRWMTSGSDVVGVTTDSRGMVPGQLFVALSGERFDGHDFLDQVAAAGAAAAIVKTPRAVSIPQLVVADPVAALGSLALAHRDRFDIPLVGLTGSNGKTTSKEMIAAVLAPLGPIHRTAGNLNNHIGVPLTLLGLEPAHRAAVVEMGMSREGEIRALAAMARPTVAVITNAGRAHLLGLGSREAVVRAKSEIAEALGPSDTLIYFGDDGLLREVNKGCAAHVVTFGLGPTPNLSASHINETGLLGSEFDVDGFGRVHLAIPGRHNVLNALAALAVSQVLGVAPDAAVRALANVRPVTGRMEVRRFGPLTIIDDSYNANPDSMRAALDLLREAPHTGRRVAVLGEMLELGQTSLSMHREVGAAASFVDALWVIGPSASEVAAAAVEAGLAGSAAHVVPDLESLLSSIPPALLPGDLILVKGSRGMALDRLVRAVETSVASQPDEER